MGAPTSARLIVYLKTGYAIECHFGECAAMAGVLGVVQWARLCQKQSSKGKARKEGKNVPRVTLALLIQLVVPSSPLCVCTSASCQTDPRFKRYCNSFFLLPWIIKTLIKWKIWNRRKQRAWERERIERKSQVSRGCSYNCSDSTAVLPSPFILDMLNYKMKERKTQCHNKHGNLLGARKWKCNFLWKNKIQA